MNPNFRSQYEQYRDAAIVVVGRPAGEGSDGYYPGEQGLADGVSTTTGNILSLTSEERDIIAEAKANFDKVVVLINSTNPMEIKELADDPDIDAILWIGFPGAYGFYGVARVLNGEVSPSAHLGDVFAVNTAAAPAMRNYGNIPWGNASDFSEEAFVNSYLIEAEGIYSGYRYYETRYADVVGKTGAEVASAGTYTDPSGRIAETSGRWDYRNEVVYPFGYGLSYTTFKQSLDSVEVAGDKKHALVKATVENTGKVPGKSVLQVYAQAPYTEYDRTLGIEKSAIQLLDFEKTRTLAPGEKQAIEMTVDLSLLASYDAQGKRTFIVDPGQYYLALGANSHDALNNVLAAQGKSISDGMDADGTEQLVHSWKWDGEVDDATFSVSDNGTPITNRLSEGDYAMDFNAFQPGTVTYLSRSNWDGTFPRTYSGLVAEGRLAQLLGNDFIPLARNEDTSELSFGDNRSSLTIADMKGADFDDPRWPEVVDKVTVAEYLNFAANAFHNIEGIPSVGLPQLGADDGPGGSDSHYLTEGQYEGKPFADAAQWDYGTRVAPSPTNLAYSWNKELAWRNGELIIGESTLMLNLPIMIGPAANLHRHAYNSRGVEYYSEDPVLSGFIGSAVVQGAQSKGSLVNLKHVAFNDQEINRSGIAVFMNEQKARELELRNFHQIFTGKGKPAAFEEAEEYADAYGKEALGMMSSYNRIGAVAASANVGVMVDILRSEWGFKGYNVTDFTSISLRAAPKESTLAGTTAFCGFGPDGIDYWTPEALMGDANQLRAIKTNIHYNLYALANSAAMNGVNSSTRTVELWTWWRTAYRVSTMSLAVLTLVFVLGWAMSRFQVNGRTQVRSKNVNDGKGRK